MKDLEMSVCEDTVSQPAANLLLVNHNTAQTVEGGFFFSADTLTLRSHRAQAEIHAIRQALGRTGWIRKRAARILAISYRSLLYKIERYKITPPVNEQAHELAPKAQSPSQTW